MILQPGDSRPDRLTTGADLLDKQFLLRICFPAAHTVKKWMKKSAHRVCK
jgi:hypothetical protein